MPIKLKPLAEQVIVITGASSGIGLVTARTAAKRGAKVVLIARSESALREVVAGIVRDGGVADCFAADVTDAAAVEAAAAFAAQRFGRIDTWVNDAGVAIYAKLLDTPSQEHQQLFQTNYFGMVHGSLAAVPHLKKQGGALITVGSIASDIPSPIMGVYSASKFAVKAYTEILRIELMKANTGISVTLVKPAGIDTPIAQHAANFAGDGGEAQLPPPVYDPQLVADAILDSAVHPRREITVGGVGRFQALFAQHFKGLFEALAPTDPTDMTDTAKPQPTPSNLFQGVRAGQERSGEHDGTARQTSFYTAAALRPKTTALGIAAVVGTASLLLFNRRK
jgi:short-subunit dehydrogenase